MPEINPSELLGQTIREIREQREMSQRQLATACRRHRTFIQRLEQGSENPSARTLLAIAAALQILPAELFRRFTSKMMKLLAEHPEKL